MSFFFILLVAGLLMICLEIFLPGGVIGLIGAFSLAGAIVVGFQVFGSEIGFYIMIGVVLLLCVSVVMWLKYFPKTGMGKSMTLIKDGKDFKSSDEHFHELVGKEGETLTDLRPAGLVKIDEVKYDVVSEGSMIDKGKKVRVIKTSGNKIVVRLVKDV